MNTENIMLTQQVGPVRLTPAAIQFIEVAAKEEIEKPEALRIGVRGGGCSGFMYTMNFISKEDIDSEEDKVYNLESIDIVIDVYSEEYLKNTTVDYVSGLKESGFKFINPEVKKTCGCGASFSA
jgi:iron-sulfur cluster assembly protein